MSNQDNRHYFTICRSPSSPFSFSLVGPQDRSLWFMKEAVGASALPPLTSSMVMAEEWCSGDRAGVLGSLNLADIGNSFPRAPWTHQNPTWLVTLGLVVWVHNVPHGPICLNTWSLGGGSVLEGKAIELFRGRGSCWGRDLRVDSSAPLSVCSLLPDCVCNMTGHLIL